MVDLEKSDRRILGLRGWCVVGVMFALIAAVAVIMLKKEASGSLERRSSVSLASGSQLIANRARSESSAVRGKRLEAEALIARLEGQMLEGETFNSEVVEKIKRVVRSIKEPGQRATVIQLFPRWLYPYLGDLALEMAGEIDLDAEGTVTAIYRKLVDVLGRIPTKESGEWLLRELKEVPDFEFPEVSPQLWSTEVDSRGSLGDVAKAVVVNGGLGDSAIMDAYVQEILGTTGARQRVLIWALGESRDYADFEFLAVARGSVKDPMIIREIGLSLNKIAAGIGLDATPSSDPGYGEYGPHFFSVFPLLGNGRQVLAERQGLAHQKAVAYLRENGLEDPDYQTKY